MATITRNTLRQLCIENDWFTCGDNSQYEKLFEANDLGVPTEQLATMIWICSDDVEYDEILEILQVMS